MTKTSNIGTAAYIAPEVMSGRSYDEKVSRVVSLFLQQDHDEQFKLIPTGRSILPWGNLL